jgi:putative CocE/NonD family hydrolase
MNIRAIAALGAALMTAGSAAGQQRQNLDSVFTRQEVRIKARDGIELFTVILTPKGRTEQLPFIFSRTPYGTGSWGGTFAILTAFRELIDDGYIFVFQDIRGQHQSGGTFVMNRPPRDRADTKSIDEATDTWDTIDWLLANIPNHNGKVGMLGISYPGFLANAPASEPHPALAALSPQATMGDTWMGDDFFHQGAFRQSYAIEWIHGREARQAGTGPLRIARYDTYDWYRSFPTLDSLAKTVGANRWPTWQRFVAHPTYDAEWQRRAVQRYLTTAPVPTLTVGGWWDQEDLFGPLATYASMERGDSARRNHLVVGPWFHGQWYDQAADSLGSIRFGRATGDDFRTLQARWFRHWLKGQGDGRFPEATVFDAGTNVWRTFDAWPPAKAERRRLYLRADRRLSFDSPTTAGLDSYQSDPANPVPYRPRPIGSYIDWEIWMTRDQRFVHGRPDVLSWETDALTEDLTIAGDVVAKLYASTTGTDADWVVKLIDVYPETITDRPAMRGYQLMVASEILRGRYWRSFERATPIPANVVTPFTVDLHQQAYTFQRGHRIMVQVQSTWFPLYDRNPQTFVPNIFSAKASDYRSATHRIHRSARHPSHVEVMVLR